ncbi:alpha/beta fold hydrolase [Alteraurantiacibacter aquimixticola]|uniref:Alpha/beta hydrolase n=1 Tax=Alteraurantiacibacter aquimixticola TaxID=2489173 RepID=A0A4V4U8T0_9SPHN|nr:alpha/beta fold hydrolase [Alteraurantiacibacter aquimixticola]TIX51277.1 alpha/beta hydrolase [Alteraurantiacibacter aquimixticola]
MDRRKFVGLAAFATATGLSSTALAHETEGTPAEDRKTFVLVHGAMCGGFFWRAVTNRLRSRGHRVYAPTLTGMADRSHLLRPDISPQDHANDVANLIKWELLKDVVLVGHSLGGSVISIVPDLLPEDTISSIVYLDAFYLESGKAVVDDAPELAALIGEDGYMSGLPIELQAGAALTDEEREFLLPDVTERLSTPQPGGTLTTPIPLQGGREKIARKTFVWAENSGIPVFGQYYERLKDNPDWEVTSMPLQHDVMWADPDATTSVLLHAAR